LSGGEKKIWRKYIVDINGDLPVILCELDGDDPNILTSSYFYADAQILAQKRTDPPEDPNFAGPINFYVHDRLGSVRLVVVPGYDELTEMWSVNAANAYTYTPFGGFYEGQCVENIDNPFKFTGQWYDAEIDQYYLRARMYDPAMMRFTARDSIRGENTEPLTLHKYLYCGNEPLNRIDPTGNKYAVMETIEAGYGNHYGALTVAAYGVATMNWDAIMLGIALDRVTKEVMLVVAFTQKVRSYDGSFGRNQQTFDNYMGNYNPGPGGGNKWTYIGLAILAHEGSTYCFGTRFLLETAFDWILGDQEKPTPRPDGLWSAD